jgi:cation:H+ antiporter
MLSGLSWDGALRRPEGVVLGAGLIVALGSMIRWSRIGAASGVPEVEEWIAGQAVRPLREAVFGLGSLGLTLAGAQILVTGARGVATDLGISEAIIGITLVAVGTSLPELATAIAAARRRKNEIVLGNVLGSNLFNALAVGGVTGAVGDGPFTASFDRPLLAMLAITILTGVLALTGHDRLARFEGFVLLLSYPALMAIL